jgi:hypothetical protein
MSREMERERESEDVGEEAANMGESGDVGEAAENTSESFI